MDNLIALTEHNGEKAVSARVLYKYFEAKERFSAWMDRQFQYGFEENVDFVGCKEFNTLANQVLQDYILTLDCAKEISMIQKNKKGRKIKIIIGSLKNICTFGMSYILIGKCVTCFYIIAGFFYAFNLNIFGSVPPCKSVMDLLPIRCKTAGKAEPFFIFSPQIKICTMSYTENQFVDKSQYAISTQQVNDLLNSIQDFFNTAKPSQFILVQNQLLNKFIESENETEIGAMFFLSSTQSEFITNLFEQFQSIHKIKNVA